jgi:hypothetical protein
MHRALLETSAARVIDCHDGLRLFCGEWLIMRQPLSIQ